MVTNTSAWCALDRPPVRQVQIAIVRRRHSPDCSTRTASHTDSIGNQGPTFPNKPSSARAIQPVIREFCIQVYHRRVEQAPMAQRLSFIV